MEARLVTLPGAAGTDGTSVRLDGTRILVDGLVLDDAGLAAALRERDAAELPGLVERALRIGLLALQDAGITVNVDVVRAEFDKVVSQTQFLNQQAAKELETTLRANFADGEGRLPQTLERFLGDRGSLQLFVRDLFDETKRDSAIGRMRELLGTYFDGDASRLAQLLDPTRMNSPLHQFRLEVNEQFKALGDKLTALEAGTKARAEERAKSSAKGQDFEDLLEAMLGDIARGLGDVVERTGTVAGDAAKSKKGDFVLSVNPDLARGADLRIAIEAKDKYLSARDIREELAAARANRNAAMAVMVFTPKWAPSGVAPFDIRFGDVYCVVDPENPEPATLEAAVRLARFHAVATLADRRAELDAEAIRAALNGIKEQLALVQSMKVGLTSINQTTKDVYGKLEQLREGIVARIQKAEAELNRQV